MADPSSEMQIPPDPGALAAKIRAAAERHPMTPAAEPEAPAAEEPAEAAPEEAQTEEAETAPAEETPAEAAAATKPGEKKPEPKPEPKTARAKEWATIQKEKGKVAKDAREIKRERDALTKERAELQKVQAELARLDKLKRENPAQFIREMGTDPRVLLKTALETPEETPQEKEIRELKETVARLSKGFEESAKERAEREATERAKALEHQQSQEKIGHLRAIAGVLDSMDDIPGIKALPAKLRNNVVFEAYDRILSTYNEKGYELPIYEVLSGLEDELYPKGQPGPQNANPSARANGAEQTAKPEAKRTPTLRSANVTSRAAAGKPASMEDRIRAAAAKLKTVSRA